MELLTFQKATKKMREYQKLRQQWERLGQSTGSRTTDSCRLHLVLGRYDHLDGLLVSRLQFESLLMQTVGHTFVMSRRRVLAIFHHHSLPKISERKCI